MQVEPSNAPHSNLLSPAEAVKPDTSTIAPEPDHTPPTSPPLPAPLPATPLTDQPAASATVAVPVSVFEQWTQVQAQQLREQIRARRWKYGFRIAIASAVLLAMLWPMLRGSNNHSSADQHIALIKLEGTIEYGSHAGAEALISALQAAFENNTSQAVIMQMNSPGGSPVQSQLIFEEIQRLRSKYDKPIYAVVEELCASGCYYVAAAADEIYVQPSSLVGSIGVIMEGFGATEMMKKLGVERRMYTAGSNKGMLDPFSPSTEKEKSMVNTMLKDVHEQFIAAVKLGRGAAIKQDPELFSGRVYTGNQSIANGLADELGSVSSVARDVVGVVNVVDYSPKENIAERVAKKLGASFGHGFGSAALNGAWQSVERSGVK